MAWINDNELLNLERARASMVGIFQKVGIPINNNATFETIYEKSNQLSSSTANRNNIMAIATEIIDDEITSVRASAIPPSVNLFKSDGVGKFRGQMVENSTSNPNLKIIIQNATTCEEATNVMNGKKYGILDCKLNHIPTNFLYSGGNFSRAIIFRNTTVPTLDSPNNYTIGTYFDLYFYENIIDEVRNATNWSALDQSRIKKIEGTIYEPLDWWKNVQI